MEHFSVRNIDLNGMQNGLFEAAITKKAHEKTRQTYRKGPRKPGLDLRVTEVRTSIQVSHLYLRALCEAACQAASECSRQAGGEDAFGAHHLHLPLPPRAAALAPLRGYDITSDGIMVHCRANEKYLQLAMENRLGVDETIQNRFRDGERMDVIRIMELADTSKAFTSAEVQAALGKPKPNVARLLKKICDAGLLKMVGSGRATKYQKNISES